MSHTFEVKILGVNSAVPVYDRHPSCQIVNFNNRLMMVDCGEGSQMQLQKYKVKRGKIDHIFISHLHGDHCFGLPGLITSYSLGNRKDTLYLHGPVGIKPFIQSILKYSGSHINFPFEICEYEHDSYAEIEVSQNMLVKTFPLKHRIPTIGFRFQEIITKKNIKSSEIERYNISIEEIKAIQLGEDIIRDGKVITNENLTLADKLPRSYSYCSDTIYDESIVKHIANSTLLYHETTYLDDLKHLADERYHTTLGGAIAIAKLSNIDRLITGHYSSRYNDISIFEEEGKKQLEGILLGKEGRTYTV